MSAHDSLPIYAGWAPQRSATAPSEDRNGNTNNEVVKVGVQRSATAPSEESQQEVREHRAGDLLAALGHPAERGSQLPRPCGLGGAATAALGHRAERGSQRLNDRGAGSGHDGQRSATGPSEDRNTTDPLGTLTSMIAALSHHAERGSQLQLAVYLLGVRT